MFEIAPGEMRPILAQSLMYLQSLDAEAVLDVLKDNILSAVGKIYCIDETNTIPAQDLMARIVANCPFKGDPEENGPISCVLATMSEKAPQVVLANLEKVFEIILDTILNADDYKLKEEKAMFLKRFLELAMKDQNGKAV